MNNNKSICALNADKNNCLPNNVIQSLSEVILSDPKNIIIPKISQALNCDPNLSLPDQELCILNKIKNKTDDENLKQAIDKQVLKNFKIPTQSLDKNYWLNNTEIDNIQFQFQSNCPGYYYSTIHMIDLENFKPSNSDIILHNEKLYNIKDIDFPKELSSKIKTGSAGSKLTYNGDLKYFGIVCNTDLSTSGGLHWFSIFIDFTKNPIQIEYFNSSGLPLTKGNHVKERTAFYEFFQNIADELSKQGFPAKFIQVTEIEHQRDDTANCGSYSLFYIWSRLKGKSHTMFTNTKITDELMEKFRGVLWRTKK
jgi:hypothetical protein